MTDQVKDKSFVLAKVLKRFGINLDHGKALDVMSALSGTDEWNVQAKKSTSMRKLTAPEQKLLDTGIANHTQFYGEPKAGASLKIALSGYPDGTWARTSMLTDLSGPAELGVTIRMALERKSNREGPKWDLYMFVTMTEKDGKWVASEWRSLNRAQLLNQTFSIKLKQNTTGDQALICPLSGVMHKAFSGIGPFVEGDEDPIWAFLVPDRVWDAAQMIVWSRKGQDVHAPYKEGGEVVVTVGEVYDAYERNMSRQALIN